MTVRSRSISVRGEDLAPPTSKRQRRSAADHPPAARSPHHRTSSSDLVSNIAIENNSKSPTRDCNRISPARLRSHPRRSPLAAQSVHLDAPCDKEKLDCRPASLRNAPAIRFVHHDSPGHTPDPLDTISPATPPSRKRKRAGASATALSPDALESPLARTRSTQHSPRHHQQHRNRHRLLELDAAEDKATKRRVGAYVESSINSDTAYEGERDGMTKRNDDAQNAVDRTPPPEQRSLRSQDGVTRSKSELALYFPNYDQLISLEPIKSESFTGTTVIKIIDELVEPPSLLLSSSANGANNAIAVDESPFGNPLLHLHNCEVIQLHEVNVTDHAEDPLHQDVYVKAHRRIERQEKHLRNIEKERAQHEKLQLERLLDELRGSDWLRTMGISGITDTEKKLYEPKRDFFIKEVVSLLEKFRIWKEEEKRRKLDKERIAATSQRPTPSGPRLRLKLKGPKEPRLNGALSLSGTLSCDKPPEIGDAGALAARQRLQETSSATARAKKSKKVSTEDNRKRPPPTSMGNQNTFKGVPSSVWPIPPSPERTFTSFYSNKRLRNAALSPHTKRGAHRLAFGHPLPAMFEREFQPPDDILTEDFIRACRRRRRRVKRSGP